MASDDGLDLAFLGEQMKRMQVDLRELRTGKADQADLLQLRADMGRLRAESRAGFRAVDGALEEIRVQAAVNLEAILGAFREIKDCLGAIEDRVSGIENCLSRAGETA